jgi:TRAP transporter TAXI family solute receptor
MASNSKEARQSIWARVLVPFIEIFGLSRASAAVAFFLVSAAFAFAIFWFFHSAPPRTITITSGPVGSSSETNAVAYRAILARNGVRLNIIPSQGSLENLHRLSDPSLKIDIGFVQSGITNELPTTNESRVNKLVSLGSITYQPLLIFYRSAAVVSLLSELKGKRLAVGPSGSGTRTLALNLLELNGIRQDGPTKLFDLDAEVAAAALTNGTVDAVFLMGDSASPKIMKQLLFTPDVQLLSFAQADAYTRRYTYLNKLELPMGSIDFGKNVPAEDVYLIGPSVEILARPNLHPALCDLLLEAAREVHGGAKLLQHKGEFPAALEHDFPLSADATRFYKSGKSFLYRFLPFWLASLVNRILVVFVPLIVVLVPGVRIIPALFRWRIRMLIYRWYRALLLVERDLAVQSAPKAGNPKELLARLDQIEIAVNKMKVPASFADQFYGLRSDIGFVRNRVAGSAPQ